MNILGAQINVTIGNLRANTEKVKAIMAETPAKVQMLVFPELTITGYPPSDLILRKGFVEEQLECAEEIRLATKGNTQLYVVIGLITKSASGSGKEFHNSLVVYHNGEEKLRYHKQLLPTYDVFDENRYFEPGSNSQLQWLEIHDEKVGFVICEDAWNEGDGRSLYSTFPVKHACQHNLDYLVTINASPSFVGKTEVRHNLYRMIATRYKTNVVWVNQVGAHDSLIFDGNSFAVNSEGLIEAAIGFGEQVYDWDFNVFRPTITGVFRFAEEAYNHLKLGIKDYVDKNGFKTVVVGCSGGIDSAVVLALAEQALGRENVFAVTMPSKVSSEGSVTDSQALCKNLGIKLYENPIAAQVDLEIASYKKAYGKEPTRLAIENMQARIRGLKLMEFSNSEGALVLSTGNKTETSVGYCTIYGDMCGGLSVIADLYKMEVYDLARWMNEYIYRDFDTNMDSGIPQPIIDKAPSAELWDNQKDTDSLPPYPILDALLKLYIEGDLLSKEETEAARNAIKVLTISDIEKYLRMTDRAEFKRQQGASILKLHRRAFGAGRVLPITQTYQPSYRNVL